LIRRLQAIEGGMGDPSEAEIEDAREKISFEYRVRRLLFSTLAAAERGAERLRAGLPARSLSQEADCILVEENRTWWPWPVDSFVDAIASLEPGNVTDPVLNEGRGQIAQLVERIPRDLTGSESRIAEGVRRRKRALAFDALVQRLQGEANLRVDDGTEELLAARIGEAILTARPENDPQFSIPALSGQERSLTVAEWTEAEKPARLSAEDFVRALRRQSPMRRAWRGPLSAFVRRLV
jgi:hypothetical protein